MLALKILGKILFGIISFFALVAITRSLWLLQIPALIWSVFLGFWFIALLTLEVLWLRRGQKPFPRLLTNLRFAPLAVLISFVAATTLTLLFNAATEQKARTNFDAVNIQQSKHKIRAYVYGNTPPEQEVTLYLFNDVGGCLNGMVAREAELYIETAREGLTNSNAAIRARALRASTQVYDSLQGGDFAFLQAVEQATRDENSQVRQIATKFLNDIKTP